MNKKLFNSFKHAFDGIYSAFSSERNMKIHCLVMLMVIILGFFCKLSIIEWIVCIFCFVLVIGSELLNTSIELIVDMICPSKNDTAKKVKDISAGAVLVFAIGTAIVGLFIFLPKILALFN